MSTIFRCVPLWLVALVAALVLWAGASSAMAADRVVLKDGRTFEGTIQQELEGYIWFRYKVGGVEQTQIFKPEDIASIVRDAAREPEAPAPGGPDATNRDASKAGAPAAREDRGGSGVPRIAILSLGEPGGKDMVGMYMAAKPLHDAIPLLEEDGVDVVVMKIQSGGGYLFEIQRLSDVIHNEYKPRFRTVAWIESAISAAAMTAHCLEEIYFMPQGHYGACTGWSGDLVAVKDRELENVLYMMERISARGGHDKQIMRSMQIMEPLSATIDENGRVHWYNDATSGKILVNPEGRVLTFNSKQAEELKFSKGTAATKEELARLMGYQEVEWVGVDKPGSLYPISRAEELQRAYRAQVYRDETSLREYFTLYQQNIAIAQGTQDKKERGQFVGRARQQLEKIKRMIKNNPNFVIVLGMNTEEEFKDWVDQQERMLRDLMR